MATLNVQNLLVEINKKIVQTSDNEELLMLSKAVSVLKTGAIFTVGTFANLPDASENVGKLYFVENDGILYFSVVSTNSSIVPTISSSEYWFPIIQLNINTLWMWGSGNFGRLGDGTIVNKVVPVTTAGGGTNWCFGSGSQCHSAAIKTDGTLWTWGCNFCGLLGDGTASTCRSSPGTVAGGGTNWCQVCLGRFHGAAIKTDGTIWTWGYNTRLGTGTTVDRCSPGTVAGGGTTWCQVSAACFTTSAIKCDGTLWTWGYNICGALGDGTTVSRCSPGTIAGGGTNWCWVFSASCHTAAIKTDGTLWTWGYNGTGQLGDGTTAAKCSPGTIAGAGTNWCQVAAGYRNNIAVKTDGTLWTWGWNTPGRLGDGTTVARSSPGTTAGCGTNWCQVSSYSAIKTDGTLWTWGSYPLGDGTIGVCRCSPGTVSGGGTKWCQAFVGGAIQRETL